MKINLLDINDEKLVKKTDMTRTFTIGGVTKEYPVYRVDKSLLKHSITNYHVATEITSLLFSKEERDMLSIYGDEICGHEERIKSIYEEKYKQSKLYSYLMGETIASQKMGKDYLEDLKKHYMGITLPNGQVIDGNFILEELFLMLDVQEKKREENTYLYLKAMNHMIRYDSKPTGFKSLKKGEKLKDGDLYFYTIIPDLNVEKDYQQIYELELELVYGRINNMCCENCENNNCTQCKMENQYNKLDLCIGMFRDILIDKKLTVEEYKTIKDKGTGYKDCDPEEYLELGKLIYEYLKFVRLPARFNCLTSLLEHGPNEVMEEFIQLREVLNSLEEEEKPVWKKILFSYCTLSAAINETPYLFIEYMPLFAEGNYKTYEKELLELSDRFEKKLNEEALITDVRALIDVTYGCMDILQGMDYIMYEAHESNEAQIEEYKKAIEEDADISVLELHIRIYNCLRRLGVVTVSQLVAIEDEDIKNLKYLSERYKKILRKVVARLKLIYNEMTTK